MDATFILCNNNGFAYATLETTCEVFLRSGDAVDIGDDGDPAIVNWSSYDCVGKYALVNLLAPQKDIDRVVTNSGEYAAMGWKFTSHATERIAEIEQANKT